MESTSGVIRAAEEVGARRVPEAGLHLQLALEQSQHAKELIASGEKKQAAALLLRAEADAELALALARKSAMHAEAQQAVEKVRALKQSAQ